MKLSKEEVKKVKRRVYRLKRKYPKVRIETKVFYLKKASTGEMQKKIITKILVEEWSLTCAVGR